MRPVSWAPPRERRSPQRCTGHACSCRCAAPWVRQILVRHHASGSVFSRSRRGSGMAFPSVSWRHTEPLGAVVLALGPVAWGRASFFALCPCASEFRWSRPRRKDSPYRGGRSPDWLKMKNPACAAVKREAVELRRPIPSYRPRAQLASRSSL